MKQMPLKFKLGLFTGTAPSLLTDSLRLDTYMVWLGRTEDVMMAVDLQHHAQSWSVY